MKTKNLFPSKYLRASDLDGDVVVTIRSCKLEQVGQEDATLKLVLHFDEVEKGLAINKTNCTVIEKLYGDDTDRWIGRPITLYATEVQFKNEMVEAIRVRLRPPTGQKPVPLAWADVQQQLAQHGLTEAWLKDELKAHGLTRFQSARDSDLVRSLITQASTNPPGPDSEDEDQIPF